MVTLQESDLVRVGVVVVQSVLVVYVLVFGEYVCEQNLLRGVGKVGQRVWVRTAGVVVLVHAGESGQVMVWVMLEGKSPGRMPVEIAGFPCTGQ